MAQNNNYGENRSQKNSGKKTEDLKKKNLLKLIVFAVAAVIVLFLQRPKTPDPGNPGPGPAQITELQTVSSQSAAPDTAAASTEGSETSGVTSAGKDTAAEKETAAAQSSGETVSAANPAGKEITVEEDGWYNDKEHVALYLHTYGHLPDNYITKTKAKKLGWKSEFSSLSDALPGMSIGGGGYANREGTLPAGHTYHECDIDYEGGKRNARRIIYSDDGLIYYTDDHYETFELLYGEP